MSRFDDVSRAFVGFGFVALGALEIAAPSLLFDGVFFPPRYFGKDAVDFLFVLRWTGVLCLFAGLWYARIIKNSGAALLLRSAAQLAVAFLSRGALPLVLAAEAGIAAVLVLLRVATGDSRVAMALWRSFMVATAALAIYGIVEPGKFFGRQDVFGNRGGVDLIFRDDPQFLLAWRMLCVTFAGTSCGWFMSLPANQGLGMLEVVLGWAVLAVMTNGSPLDETKPWVKKCGATALTRMETFALPGFAIACALVLLANQFDSNGPKLFRMPTASVATKAAVPPVVDKDKKKQ